MAGLTKEHQRLIKYAEAQGVTTKRTRKGIYFYFPNGQSDLIHWTQSDWRATRNSRANWRRNGIAWPGDDSQHGGERSKPRATTMARVNVALDQLTPEQREKGVSVTEISTLSGVTFFAVENSMRAAGWWKDFGVQAKWFPPILDPNEVVEEVEVEDDDEIPTQPVEDQAPVENDHAPWTVTLASLVVPGLTVEDLVATFQAMGLEAEVKLWRK
jgi:hypothetical protein